MKQIEKTSLSKYCNDKPNKFGCHEISNYALAQRNSRARKGKLGYHTKAKGTALSKEENSRKDQAGVSFVERNGITQNDASQRKKFQPSFFNSLKILILMMNTMNGLTIQSRHYSQLTHNLKSLIYPASQMSQKNLQMMNKF